MTTFTGKDGVTTYVAIAVKSGLKLYAKSGMQPNRQWTPKAMMAAASRITGQQFKRRDYAGAIAALDAWIAANGTNGGAR